MYLLDTNVISEFRKARPHGEVLAWLNQVRQDALFVSAVSLGEIQIGIEITREQDPRRAAELEIWLNEIIGNYSVLAMDAAVFRIWATLMHRKPEVLTVDAIIAATAIAHDLVVVTRNVRDFRVFEVDTLNPYDTPRVP